MYSFSSKTILFAKNASGEYFYPDQNTDLFGIRYTFFYTFFAGLTAKMKKTQILRATTKGKVRFRRFMNNIGIMLLFFKLKLLHIERKEGDK